mmetsp:Transcript_14264/g.28924  ORF Transcript_14264/g.28924 Transcript_14264/m.28924 type:complete len:246 (-) Transcript_14264:103-840(-)
MASAEKADFTISPVLPDEYEACIEIAAAAFTTNNPMVMHLGFSTEEFKPMARLMVPKDKTVDTGLSIGARSADGKLLAFLFLQKFDIKKKDPTKDNARSAIVYEMAERIYETACSSPPPRGLCLGSLSSGKTLHCSMGGTFSSAGGKGIGKALRLRAVEVARERGFNTLVVEPGHGATRHIWSKYCGMTIKGEQLLATYRSKKGDYPFQGVEGTLSVAEIVVRKSRWDHAFFWPFYLGKLILQTP